MLMLAEKTRIERPPLDSEAGCVQQGLVTTSLNAQPAPTHTRETIKQRVLRIVELYPECKGNYNLLLTRYHWYYHWRRFGCSFKDVLSLPSPENVSRRFREAVAEGLIKLTPEQEARRAKYKKSPIRT